MSSSYGVSIGTTNYGTGNGIDVQSMVDQALANLRKPEQLLQSQQSVLQTKMAAIQSFQIQLSTLESSVAALKDPLGVMSRLAATSSNTAALTATLTSGATAGTHTVQVGNLAATSSAYSDPLDSANDSIGSGDLVFTIGTGDSQTISFSEGTTLSQAVDQINKGNYGVTASVITDATGARLTLTSKMAGSAGTITITSAPSNLALTATAGQNASAIVDGVPVSSATNTISGVISGVTLNLASATNGAQVSLTIGADTTGASQAVQMFVTNYNNLMTSINQEFTYTGSSATAGVLSGDSSLTMIQSSLLQKMSATLSGNTGVQSLSDLGITMNNDGTLTLNQTELDNTISNNFSAVQSFFKNSSSTGFAQTLDSYLQTQTDPTTGSLQMDYESLQQSDNDLTRQINDMEARITAQQASITDEFSKINTVLQTFPTTMQQVEAELGSLSTNSQSNS